MEKLGMAAIIFAIGAFITAVGSTVINFVSLKWVAKIYEPVDNIVRRAEPVVNKMLESTAKQLDNDD